MTESLCVIGDPISHSLSPAMQTAALRHAGLDWTYVARHVATPDLAAAVDGFRRDCMRGFNVTIPHKQAVRRFLDAEDDSAGEIGAVNTVVCGSGGLVGYNTDVDGIGAAVRALRPSVGVSALVFGSGGSARAAILALARLDMQVTVVSRDVGRAAAAARLAADSGRALTYDDRELEILIRESAVLVNATPLGMAYLSHGCPLPAGAVISPSCVGLDLVYGRQTPFLRRLQTAGARATDGLEVLVQQGARSFALWTGLQADLDVMRAACLAALEERKAC